MNDSAVVKLLSPGAVAAADAQPARRWFQTQLDDQPWRPATTSREITLERLAAGKHRLRARAFDSDLNGDPSPAVLEWEIKVDPESQQSALIAELAHPELDRRELAVKALRQHGAALLPRLRAVRDAATTGQQWWIDAVIQQIERDRKQAAEPCDL